MATPPTETTEQRQYTTLLSHHENNSRQGAEIQLETERETPERLTDRSRGTWKRQKLEENKIFRVNWTQYQGRTKDMLTGKPQPYYHIKTEARSGRTGRQRKRGRLVRTRPGDARLRRERRERGREDRNRARNLKRRSLTGPEPEERPAPVRGTGPETKKGAGRIVRPPKAAITCSPASAVPSA